MNERATIAYLVDRMTWQAGTTGRSSDALVREACGGRPVDADEYPVDTSDLGRCVMAYDAAPWHLKRRMQKRMDDFSRSIGWRRNA